MGRLIVLASIAAELRLAGVLPPIIYGVPYSASLRQVGGSGVARFTGSGTRPTGIDFTDNGDGTCTFSGTTTDPGDFPVTVDGLDADRTPATANYVLRVQVLPISITGDAPDMRIGDADATTTYVATGGSGTGYTFARSSGALPPGWTLDPDGTLHRSATTAGAYSWAIVCTDSLGNVSGVYADSATVFYGTVTLTGAFASVGVIGVPYSSDIPIGGGDGAYSNPLFTAGAVSGMALTIVTVGGVKKLRLSGTPTTQETDSITVTVDSHDFDGTLMTGTHSQSITEDPALTLTGTFTSPASPGAAYQSRIAIGGGSATYSLHGGSGVTSGALPTGGALSIVTVSGVKYLQLDGPLTKYSGAFTVQVDDADGQTVSLTITVVVTLTLTGSFATPLYSGVAYTQNITIAGGTGSGNYALHGTGLSSGALPTSLALSVAGANLNLAGTCTTGVTSTFVPTVEDSLGNVAMGSSQSLTRQDSKYSTVVSQLRFNGTNGATTFPDERALTWSISNGTPAISTSAPKWGTGCLSGSGRIGTPTGSNFAYNAAFTLRTWFKTSSNSTNQVIAVCDGAASLHAGHSLSVSNTGKLVLRLCKSSDATQHFDAVGTTVISTGAYHHAECSYDGNVPGTAYVFLDGNLEATVSITAAIKAPAGRSQFLMQYYDNTQGLAGQLDDFEFNSGTCRHTASFSVPADENPIS